MDSSLSIITPIYNEEEVLFNSIQSTLNSAQLYFKNIEYIIINDGSTDNSKSIIDNNFDNDIFKIVHKTNGGFGSAIKTGLALASKEYVICIPADSPLDIDTAKTFFEAYKKADIVVSYRVERMGYSKWMLFNSTVFHFLVSNLFNIKLQDFNWIHLYKTQIFKYINIQSKGIFMLAEVLIKAKEHNFSFIEIPVHQKQRLTGIATASKPSAVLKTIIEMCIIRLGVKI